MLESMLFAVVMLLCMMAMLEAGRRLHRRHKASGDTVVAGVATLESAVFGLFGLLLAFTFSGAVERFNTRRSLIIQEANAIENAWQRLELLPAKERSDLQDRFRKYLDARLAAYRQLPDVERFMAGLNAADAVYDGIWSTAVLSSLDPKRPVDYGLLLLPALQRMSDMAMERTAAFKNHPPIVIFAMLFVLSLLSSLLAGYTLGDHEGRRAIHRAVFAFAVALTVYITVDLEYPRFGLIRVDAADAFLVQVRQKMK